MGNVREVKKDFFSVKLFFLILGGIAAYNINDWLRGEPEWEELSYDSGGFVAQTAGKPDLRKLREKLAFGEVEFQFLMFERGEIQYAITYGEIPESISADSAIAANRDAILRKVEGKILDEEDVVLGGHPARKIRIQAADESLMRVQSTQVGQRLYSLMAAGAPYLFNDNPELLRFFSSFRFVEP